MDAVIDASARGVMFVLRKAERCLASREFNKDKMRFARAFGE
jgi:hypothetical protein